MENNLHTLTDANFREEVLEYSGPLLLQIYADWSGCCHIMTQILENLAVEFKGEIKFAKRNMSSVCFIILEPSSIDSHISPPINWT